MFYPQFSSVLVSFIVSQRTGFLYCRCFVHVKDLINNVAKTLHETFRKS